MPWTYDQATGNMTAPDGVLLTTGYSGTGLARNMPEAEGQHGAKNAAGTIVAGGPIPRGTYFLSELMDPHPRLGAYAIRLVPDEPTRAKLALLDRGDYWIHGDDRTHNASEGCIVLFHFARVAMWTSPDHDLLVV